MVPALNAAATIEGCLAALAEQTVKPGEVIVVDDGSTDSTPEIARRMGAEVLTQENAGAGAARNRGAKAARGELLLFTDADCAPVRDWVERLADPLEGDGVVAARGVTASDQPEPAARFAQLEYDEKYRQLARHDSVAFVATYSAAYRRDEFWRFGGFDEGFAGATSEDQELSFRLADAGLKIAFVPRAAVRHHHHTTLQAYVRRKFRIGYAKARIGRSHPDKLIQDTYTPLGLKLQVGFAGVVVLGLAAAPVRRSGLRMAALGAAGFAASSVPFLRFGRSREPGLTARLPAYLIARALALGSGFAPGHARGASQRPQLSKHASVIVPSLTGDRLDALLDSLAAQTADHQVIVVDNGCPDASVERACESHPGVERLASSATSASPAPSTREPRARRGTSCSWSTTTSSAIHPSSRSFRRRWTLRPGSPWRRGCCATLGSPI